MRFSSPHNNIQVSQRPISGINHYDFFPRTASPVPTFAEVVVFPTPPFPEVITMTSLMGEPPEKLCFDTLPVYCTLNCVNLPVFLDSENYITSSAVHLLVRCEGLNCNQYIYIFNGLPRERLFLKEGSLIRPLLLTQSHGSLAQTAGFLNKTAGMISNARL